METSKVRAKSPIGAVTCIPVPVEEVAGKGSARTNPTEVGLDMVNPDLQPKNGWDLILKIHIKGTECIGFWDVLLIRQVTIYELFIFICAHHASLTRMFADRWN